jgi:hypothetical protein
MNRKKDFWWARLAVLILFFSCGCSSALDKIDTVPVRLPDGSIIKAELAIDPEVRKKGLMFRQSLPEGRGMLFVFDKEEEVSFWMKDVYIDLDIIFLGSDKKVRNIFEGVPAAADIKENERIPAVRGIARYVLELPSGSSRRHNISGGSKLYFELIGTDLKN